MFCVQQFEVFYDDPLEPLPVGSFREIESAMAAMHKFASRVPGYYFVWSLTRTMRSRPASILSSIISRLQLRAAALQKGNRNSKGTI